MKALDVLKIQTWCRRREIVIDSFLRPSYGTVAVTSFELSVPERAYGIAPFAHYLVDFDPVDSEQGIFWITKWGAWSEEAEGVGLALMRKIRRAEGIQTEIDVEPGMSFNTGTATDIEAALLVPMLIGCDAFLVPGSGTYFVYIDHDGIVFLVSSDVGTIKRLSSYLEGSRAKNSLPHYLHTERSVAQSPADGDFRT